VSQPKQKGHQLGHGHGHGHGKFIWGSSSCQVRNIFQKCFPAFFADLKSIAIGLKTCDRDHKYSVTVTVTVTMRIPSQIFTEAACFFFQQSNGHQLLDHQLLDQRSRSHPTFLVLNYFIYLFLEIYLGSLLISINH
jgi:hypothetical protein